MKKVFSYFVILLAAAGMFACAPKHDKTIADLKSAINGESTASAKYAAFAAQAATDSLYAVEALFKATSQAEAIHVKNHQAVLVALGVADYQPVVEAFEVKTTAENLQAAIEGENYESSTMYPGFIANAESEKVAEAVSSYNFAQEAEKDHARLYSEVLAQLATPEMIATTYYLCPVCGFVYAGTPAEVCELCQTPAAQFVAVEAVIPVAEVVAEEAPAAQK